MAKEKPSMKDVLKSIVQDDKTVTTNMVMMKTNLNQIELWKYARCIDEQYVETEDERKRIKSICVTLEMLTGTPARIFRESYRMDDVLKAYETALKVLSQPLPEKQITEFTFTTLTTDDKSARVKQAKSFKNLFTRGQMMDDIKIDENRVFKLVKTDDSTFQQFILSEELNKKLFTNLARIEANDINSIAGVLAYVYRVDGDELFTFNERESKFIFNFPLIEKRKQIFRNLDIVTAWSAYNGFFLSGNQSSKDINGSGTIFQKVFRKALALSQSILNAGDGTPSKMTS